MRAKTAYPRVHRHGPTLSLTRGTDVPDLNAVIRYALHVRLGSGLHRGIGDEFSACDPSLCSLFANDYSFLQSHDKLL